MGNTILAVGAHPDDIELGAGGTLRQHVLQGDKVYGLVLTKGEKGGHCGSHTECKKSADFLQLEDLFILNYPDGKLGSDIDVVSSIESYIKKLQPNILYTHGQNDLHQDHVNCCMAARRAVRKGKVDSIYLFQSPSTELGFLPHHFSEITHTLMDKMMAFSYYASQIKRNSIDYLEWIKDTARAWGRRQGVPYAEAFEVNHSLKRQVYIPSSGFPSSKLEALSSSPSS